MDHVMIDLETMGTKPYSVIVALGAVMFDPSTKDLGPTFYRVVDMESCVRAGLGMELGTVKWWLNQSDEAREIFKGSAIPLDAVLKDFFNFLDVQKHPTVKVWGNGSDFDNVLLNCAYEKIGVTTPWKFYNNRCYRTVKNLEPNVKIERQGTHHNALDDAVSQAMHLQKIASGRAIS